MAVGRQPGKLVFFRRRFYGALRPIEYSTPVLIPVGVFSGDLPNGQAVETNPNQAAFESANALVSETSPTYENFESGNGDVTETNPTYTTELNP